MAHPSMEPPPFGDGNSMDFADMVGRKQPSMEPPPFGDGNCGDAIGLPPESRPSMEPPPFGDGNRAQAWPRGLRALLNVTS